MEGTSNAIGCFCPSVRLFASTLLNQVTFDLACVWIMTISCLGLKVKVKGQNAVNATLTEAILISFKRLLNV